MAGLIRLVEMHAGLFAHASGALWIPGSRAAIVADAHLGYGWAQRRRGQLGPVSDHLSAPKLAALLGELNPRTLVFLGDVVHAPKPDPRERGAIEETLRNLTSRVEIVIVRGNHDRAFARDFGHLNLPVVEAWEAPGIVARHGDKLNFPWAEGSHLLLGHLHPSLSIRDAAGASQRVPVFLFNDRVTLLPAFSPFAAGFNITLGLPPEWKALFEPEGARIVAVTGQRAMLIPRP
jgi:metallophosphoesterase superfamily enzyme